MSNKKIKIGVIGLGSIAKEHLDSYRENPNCELYAFCDVSEKQLKLRSEEYGVARLFTSIDEMVALPELDAVSVCVFNSLHAEASIKALRAGKHVLCEKPMATNLEDALEMERVAKENGKLLMIAFVRRFANDAETVKEYIDSGFMGDIYYARATYLRRHGNPGGWFGNKEFSGGGPLIDLGVHVIDLTRYLCGNPKPVSVYGATFQKLFNRPGIKDGLGWRSVMKTQECNVEDFVTALVRYDNGCVLEVSASFSLNIKEDKGEIELCGTKAGAKLSPELEIYSQMNDRMINIAPYTSATPDFTTAFRNEINHFVDCVKDGVACRAPASDGVEVMRIIDAIYRSAETGHEVIL